eukprot:SAG22_NODE_9246_length_601_cov_0.599602_2_plen_48_part_01
MQCTECSLSRSVAWSESELAAISEFLWQTLYVLDSYYISCSQTFYQTK